jgi:hypothetical protein
MRPTITKMSNIVPVCSRGCIHNWTNYNQKPPVWQSCQCHKKIQKIISVN